VGDSRPVDKLWISCGKPVEKPVGNLWETCGKTACGKPVENLWKTCGKLFLWITCG
jgi:hypothetical protein